MIFNLLTPRGWGHKCASAHPIHVNNSKTEFGRISSDGLRGDRITYGEMDGRLETITISLLLS